MITKKDVLRFWVLYALAFVVPGLFAMILPISTMSSWVVFLLLGSILAVLVSFYLIRVKKR